MSDELEMTRQVIAWLKANDYTCWRMPIAGGRKAGGMRITSPLKGFPDVAGLLKTQHGRFFAIELKTAKGVMSEAQGAWCGRLTVGGAVVFTLRSVEGLELAMELAEQVP